MIKNKVNVDSNGYQHAYVPTEDLKEGYPYIYGSYNTIGDVLVNMGLYEKVAEELAQKGAKAVDDFLDSESPDINLLPGWLTEKYNHYYGEDTPAKRLFKSLSKEEKKLFLYGVVHERVHGNLSCTIDYAKDNLLIFEDIWQKDEFVEGWEDDGRYGKWHYWAFKFPAKYKE